MKKNLKRITAVLLGIAVILSAVLLIRHRRASLEQLATPSIPPIPVVIKKPVRGILPITEHYLGTIEPMAEAVLSAQTTGYIVSIHKDVGDRIEKGESVVNIDNRLPTRQKSALEAEISGAREELKVKKTELDRHRQLYKSEVTTKESLDEANLAYELALSRVQRLNQELEALNVSLTFTRIRSPLNGVVTDRMKDPGDLVMPGTPILTIEDMESGYKIIIHVPQETVLHLAENAPLRLIHEDNVINASVYQSHPRVSSANLVKVEARVQDRPFGLPSYATVGVDLTVHTPEGLVVSSDCIFEQEAGALVFVIKNGETVEPVAVTIVGRNDEKAVITGLISSNTYLASGPESMLLQLNRHGRIVQINAGEK